MRKVRYGMIGFGGIAENRIAREGFACDPARFTPAAEAELLAVTDLNPARREAAEKMGLKWYDDAASLLADTAIDAVCVATNNLTHAAIVTQALNAGRHVLVEKPMASSSQEARSLVELAKTKRLSLAVDHMMIENAWNRAARTLVGSGKLGTVNDSCFHMEFSFGATPDEAASWRCARPEEMGGPIGDVASHCFYMAEFIFNSKVAEVACVYYPKQMNIKVEDGAYIKYRMQNGLTGSIRVAFSEPRGSLKAMINNLGYELFGTDGVLRGYGTMFQLSGFPDEPVKIRLALDNFSECRDIGVGKITGIYQEVIRRHARSIIDNHPMDGSDGLHNLQLIEAAHESARNNGKPITICL